jgi:hypothetical protein
MPLVLKQKEPYRWPLKITLPADDGKRLTESFTGVFAWVSQSRIEEIRRTVRLQSMGIGDDDQQQIDDITAAKEVMVGWSDVLDDEGDEVPFSDRALDQLLQIPTVAGQIVKQWQQSLEATKKGN